MIMADVMSLTL